jgi:hypothetical protein
MLVAGLLAGPAQAQLLYDIDVASGGTVYSGSGYVGNWGFQFNTSSSFDVGSLGLWDQGSDGILASHQVGLFDLGGSLLVSATVTNASTVVASTNSGGQWLFTALPSLYTLPAGSYVFGYFNELGSQDLFRSATTTFMPDSSLTEARGGAGASSFAQPNTFVSGLGLFGPNLQVGVVPEPSTIALAGLGAIGLLVAARRRNK